MNKIAIVVQRCHSSIVGGSESLAVHYANLLKDEYKVHILTTTALDITTWSNELPVGEERTSSGIVIHRFSVSLERSDYWHQLNYRLSRTSQGESLVETQIDCKERKGNHRNLKINWTLALQEEYIRYQGPYSVGLLNFLKQYASDYKVFIFVTYLYPTVYFGISQVPREKAVLVPTLHDEIPAYLNAYRLMAHQARKVLWLTDAEKKFGETLWGQVPGEVVSMGISTDLYSSICETDKYILYCGRIDIQKGCQQLFEYFMKFKERNSLEITLIITGKEYMPIPNHPHIKYKGFVTEDEKFSLMAGACAFVMPSPYESFSIVTLEAMSQKTPVLVNGKCVVLAAHVDKSEAGKIYTDYESFAKGLKEIIESPLTDTIEEGLKARKYVLDNYSSKIIKAKLLTAIE